MLSGGHWQASAKEALRFDDSEKIVLLSPSQQESSVGKQDVSAGKPQTDSEQKFLAPNAPREPSQGPSPPDTDSAAVKQHGLKVMPLQQDSAVSGNTAEAALGCSCSQSTPSCMELEHNAAPQQVQGAAVPRASSGSIDASSSPKSGSVYPTSGSPLVPGQNQVHTASQAGGGNAPHQQDLSGAGHNQHSQSRQAQQQQANGTKQQDASNMPIARFDPSLVAAVKCAADILQTDDGWSKEEAAATIAALTAKFQNAKNRSAAAAAASAGRAAANSLGTLNGMLGQPGGPASGAPHSLHNVSGQVSAVSSLLACRNLLTGAQQSAQLHPMLTSHNHPAADARAPNTSIAAAANSQPGDRVANGAVAMAVLAGDGAGPGGNMQSRANSIPGWGSSAIQQHIAAGQAAGVEMKRCEGPSELHVKHHELHLHVSPAAQQPHSSERAAALGVCGAACSGSTGTPAGSRGAPLVQEGAPTEAGAGQGADADGKGHEAVGVGAAESSFARKPSVTSSGLCSVMEPRQHAEDAAAAGEEAEQQQQQQQQVSPVASPSVAVRNNLPDAAAVAAAAVRAAAVHAALQRQEEEEQRQQRQQQQQQHTSGAPGQQQSTAMAAALQLPGSQKVTSSVISALMQSCASQACGGQPQLPIALLALLQSNQKNALPLMSALLRSGNLKPADAEALKARLASCLQQQQGIGVASRLPDAAVYQNDTGTAAAFSSQVAATPYSNEQAANHQQHQHMQEPQQQVQQPAAQADMAAHRVQDQQQQGIIELQQQKDIHFALQQRHQQYKRQEQQQQQQFVLQSDAPAESESRSVESIAAATSHASADAAAAEPVGRRKRGRQPSAKAAEAAAAAAKEDGVYKRQAKGPAASQDAAAVAAAAASAQSPGMRVVQKGKRGRPSKASKVAAAAAAAARSGEEGVTGDCLQGMPSNTWLPSGLGGMYTDMVDAPHKVTGSYPHKQTGMGHLEQDAAAAAAAPRYDALVMDRQQSMQQLHAGSSIGMQSQPGCDGLMPQPQQQQQQQHMLMQRSQQQNQQQQQQVNTGTSAAAAAAAQQQFQQQLQQLPPINTGSSAPPVNSTQQLLQQLQQLPPAAAQQVAKMAQTMPPDLPPQMRQSLLRWAVNTVMQNMGLGDEGNSTGVAAQNSQQQQQQQQLGGAPGVMWGTAAAQPAAAVADPAFSTADIGNLQQQGSGSAPAGSAEGGNAVSGLLTAAQSHPGLKNMNQQDREAVLKRLLQQRNARLFAQGSVQQQQQPLDPAAAAAAPVDDWPPRSQQYLQTQHSSAAASGGGVLASVSWANDPAALAAQAQVASQVSGIPGFRDISLDQAGSLPLPQGAGGGGVLSAAATSGPGAPVSMIQHAATMPEGLGDATTAAAARAAALDGSMAGVAALAAPGTSGSNTGSMHPAATSGIGSTAAAGTALPRPHYMQSLEYQLQVHGMSKKQLLELMKEIGPIEALKSIGMHHSVLQGQPAPSPAANAALPAAPATSAAGQPRDPAAAMSSMVNVHHQQQLQHVESLQQQMQQQQQQQQQQTSLYQRLQQLAGFSGPHGSMFSQQQQQLLQQQQQQQQQQQLSYMLNRTGGTAMATPFSGTGLSGVYNSSGNTGNNYGSAANGSMSGMLPAGHDLASAGILGNGSGFPGSLGLHMPANSMLSSLPASYDTASGAAAAPASAAAATAARLQLPKTAAAGATGAYSAAAAAGAGGAGMQGGSAGGTGNWMSGAGAAGFSVGLGEIGDNYNSRSAALDPPVLELPDLGLKPGTAATAAAASGGLRPSAPQQNGHRPAGLSADLPGSLLGMHNDGEDLLGSLGLDIAEVDTLLAGMDTGAMAGDGGFGMTGGAHAAQGMADIWSSYRAT